MRALVGLSCCAVLPVIWTVCQPAAEPQPRVLQDFRRKVLIIGIDGCRTDALLMAHTPGVDELVSTGLFFDNVDILGPGSTGADTVSGPGWANLLTGVWPNKHGIRDNSFEGQNQAEFPDLFARLEEVRPALRTASLASWDPIADMIIHGADERLGFNGWGMRTYEQADRAVVARARKMLTKGDIDSLFVYLGSADANGHTHGFHPSVPQYMEALETIDGQIRELIQAIRSRSTFADEDWLVIICTDHGGEGMGHYAGHDNENVRRVFLVLNHLNRTADAVLDPAIDDPSPVDVAPTVCAHLGIHVPLEWNWDGRPIPTSGTTGGFMLAEGR